MASKKYCMACLRQLRQQSQSLSRKSTSIRLPISRPAVLHRTFNTAPKSLAVAADPTKIHAPAPVLPPKADPPSKNAKFAPEESPNPSTKQTIAKELRKRATNATETYVAYGVAEKLMKECAKQANYSIPQAAEKGVEIPKTKEGEDLGVGEGWWYTDLGLTPTFNTWAQITFLHMYLLTVRFRYFPPDHAPAWHQHLADHFFYAAEDRMVVMHNVHARTIRNKYLKDLFVQWRGLTAGYDEGLIKGDAVLATAVWRNVFKGNEKVDLKKLGEVVSYMRRVLAALDRMGDEQVASGRISFGSPGSEGEVVKVHSRLMDEPFKEEELKEIEEKAT
ncbi:MAG: Protein cbp3, mitochondrial [Pycnora praestabilis]|nr:MAG: Protein cbp3, mitochondrial [Pycnora praestabilis]